MTMTLSLRYLLVVALSLSSSAAFAQGIKATTTVHNDGTRTETIMDTEKRTMEETVKTMQEKVLRRTMYQLDFQNQPISAVAYDGKGTILYRSTYRRDGMNRIDEETVTNAAGQMIRKRLYHYGVNNKVARIDEYDQNGNLIIPQKKSAARPDKKKRR